MELDDESVMPFGRTILFAVSLWLAATTAGAEPRRRALLIGINDYGAGRQSSNAVPAGRVFTNLRGAVNDVHLMRDILLSVYKFKPEEIVMLTDGAANRDAILNAIDRHLIDGAQRDDVCLFYFSGHGSQVKNSRSEELDRMDESIVPADTREGIADIRDKELRRLFRPLLDRGARLTTILDSVIAAPALAGCPAAGRPDSRDRTSATPGTHSAARRWRRAAR